MYTLCQLFLVIYTLASISISLTFGSREANNLSSRGREPRLGARGAGEKVGGRNQTRTRTGTKLGPGPDRTGTQLTSATAAAALPAFLLLLLLQLQLRLLLLLGFYGGWQTTSWRITATIRCGV